MDDQQSKKQLLRKLRMRLPSPTIKRSSSSDEKQAPSAAMIALLVLYHSNACDASVAFPCVVMCQMWTY